MALAERKEVSKVSKSLLEVASYLIYKADHTRSRGLGKGEFPKYLASRI